MIGDCAGVVLAGGASRRMGRDKAMIVVRGETMLEKTCRVLRAVFDEVLCVGRVDDASNLPVACVADERPGKGPLGGIETALRRATSGWVFVAACDMPLLTADTIEELWEKGARGASGAVVARIGERIHPLAAFYPRDVLPSLTETLDAGRLAATEFVRGIDPCVVDAVADGALARALTNVNDPEELARVADGMHAGGRRE